MNHHPEFSIDLDAELKKISQRQHLNDVHYLVALVRHGLAHHPSQMNIRSQRNQLTFSQNGVPLEDEEWQILTQLLTRGHGDEDHQQRALEMLETVYGIALLSIFLSFETVTLISNGRCLRKTHGQVVTSPAGMDGQGYHIKIARPRAHREKEFTELCFYCAGAKVPITYNGRAINEPLALKPCMLAMTFETEDGHGWIGIPAEGELSRFYFYKAGIRIGVKTATPVEGRIVEGFWDASSPQFESLYQPTIQSGQPLLESNARKLYRAIPNHFPKLPLPYRTRLRKILLGMAPLGWADEYGKVPLFANSSHTSILCLEDLMKLQKQFEVLPFLPKARPKAPGFLPVLSHEDQYFLSHQLNMTLSPFLEAYDPPKPDTTAIALEKFRELEPGKRKACLKALNQQALPHIFKLGGNAISTRVGANGMIEIRLCPDEPLVREALESISRDPAAATKWRYRLIAAAGQVH